MNYFIMITDTECSEQIASQPSYTVILDVICYWTHQSLKHLYPTIYFVHLYNWNNLMKKYLNRSLASPTKWDISRITGNTDRMQQILLSLNTRKPGGHEITPPVWMQCAQCSQLLLTKHFTHSLNSWGKPWHILWIKTLHLFHSL